MNVSKELLKKAKTAKSAEELLELAKAENIELSAEQVAQAFVQLNKNGGLSDGELDNVSGGCKGRTPKFSVNDRVSHKGSDGKVVYGTVVRRGSLLRSPTEYFHICYVVDDGETTEKIYEESELTLAWVEGIDPEICKSIQ